MGYEVRDYTFESLLDGSAPDKNLHVTDYKIAELSDDQVISREKRERIIRRERQLEKKSPFRISDIVRKDRGINRQEEEDYQKRVAREVEKKVEQLKQNAYQEGYSAGEEKGYAEALEKATAEYDDRVNKLNDLVDSVVTYRKDLVDTQRLAIYRMVKSLCKWVVLREVRDDNDYLSRLLEKLVLELHSKSDLLIRVNESDFDNMPKALEILENKIGKLTNVRLEVDRDMVERGIVLESKNGIVDGSLDSQLKSIDKLFEGIGVMNE